MNKKQIKLESKYQGIKVDSSVERNIGQFFNALLANHVDSMDSKLRVPASSITKMSWKSLLEKHEGKIFTLVAKNFSTVLLFNESETLLVEVAIPPMVEWYTMPHMLKFRVVGVVLQLDNSERFDVYGVPEVSTITYMSNLGAEKSYFECHLIAPKTSTVEYAGKELDYAGEMETKTLQRELRLAKKGVENA